MQRCKNCGGIGYRTSGTISGHETGKIVCGSCGKSTRRFIIDGSFGSKTTWEDVESAWNDGCIYPDGYVSVAGIAKYLANAGYMPSEWCESAEQREKAWAKEIELALVLGDLNYD